MDKDAGVVGVCVLDARLRCDAADCAAREIALRLDDNARLLQSLARRRWRCPVCGGPAALEWLQLADIAKGATRMASC